MNLIEKLINKNLLLRGQYPYFIKDNTIYQCIMGSEAYGIASDSSDKDI